MMRNPFKGNRKTILKGVFAVLAVVAALSLGMGLRALRGVDRAEAPAPKVTQAKTNTPATGAAKADQLANQGKADEATKYISDQLAQPGVTDAQKYDLFIKQALIYYNDNKLDDALAYDLKADAIKPGRGLAEAIADIAMKLGKKDVAITYYKKAITLLPKTSPVYTDDKAGLEQKLKNAGGAL